MSRSLCPGLDPHSSEKRLKRVTKINIHFSFTCGHSGSGAQPRLGMSARGAGGTRGWLCLQRSILPGRERKGDPKGAHQSSWVMQTPILPGVVNQSYFPLNTWKSPKTLVLEGEQAVLQRKASDSRTRVHQQLPPLLKLDPEAPVSP